MGRNRSHSPCTDPLEPASSRGCTHISAHLAAGKSDARSDIPVEHMGHPTPPPTLRQPSLTLLEEEMAQAKVTKSSELRNAA